MFISHFYNAQVWVKPNATWHYDFSTIGYGGFMKIEHIADTLIDSKNSMVFETTINAFTGSQNGTINLYFSDTLQRNYTYVNGDTVFYWKNNQFEVLYNFSEAAGGEWMLGSEIEEMYMCNDTSIVEVISSDFVTISETNYRALTLQSNNSSPFRFEGKFNERFGAYEGNGPWSFLFPNFASCDPTIIFEYYTFTFKCFQDDELFYNPNGEDCEYLLNHLNLFDLENNILNIHPNPTNGLTWIDSRESIKNIQLQDSHGKITDLTQQIGNEKIELYLNPGFYFLSIVFEDGRKLVRKIVSL